MVKLIFSVTIYANALSDLFSGVIIKVSCFFFIVSHIYIYGYFKYFCSVWIGKILTCSSVYYSVFYNQLLLPIECMKNILSLEKVYYIV